MLPLKHSVNSLQRLLGTDIATNFSNVMCGYSLQLFVCAIVTVSPADDARYPVGYRVHGDGRASSEDQNEEICIVVSSIYSASPVIIIGKHTVDS